LRRKLFLAAGETNMTGKGWIKPTALACSCGFALAGGPLGAAGFTAPDPGIKAMCLAGAFTAQASDPTASFYNPGGLALLKKGKLTAGLAADYLNESQYQGAAPGIGAGQAGQQKKAFTILPHLYAVKPLGDKLKLGVAVYTPYAFKTEWEDPGAFAGRYLTTRGQLQSYDVNTNLSWKVTPSLGFGAGVIYQEYVWFADHLLDAGIGVGYTRLIERLAFDVLGAAAGATLLVLSTAHGLARRRRLPWARGAHPRVG
jgi:long-subunit fatty acid transport protein